MEGLTYISTESNEGTEVGFGLHFCPNAALLCITFGQQSTKGSQLGDCETAMEDPGCSPSVERKYLRKCSG